MRCNSLAISQSAEFGIFSSARSGCILHQFFVKLIAFLNQGAIFFIRFLKLRDNGFIIIPVPVRTQIGFEILNGINIVIANHNFSLTVQRRTQRFN